MKICRATKIMGIAAMLAMPMTKAHSQSDTLGMKSRMIAVGAANVLDTYLSPEKYKGTEVRYIYHSTRPTRWKDIEQTVMHQGELTMVKNRADNNNELGAQYNLQYHMRRRWQLTPQLAMAAGAAIDTHLGFLYNTRNSNNPAQAQACLNIGPSAAVSYSTRIKSIELLIGYEAMAPLAGVMFSPNYGQSYYEIFSKGNYDHNVVFTTIATTPSLMHMLTVDLRPWKRWSRTFLRIGYMGDYQQARINNLKQHHYSHMFILGISTFLRRK